MLAYQLSGYTFDLFREVERVADVKVRFLYAPIDGTESFEHERTGPMDEGRLWWGCASWSAVRAFVREPAPEIVFMHGVTPRFRMRFAVSHLPPSARVYYVSDANSTNLEAACRSLALRRLAYRFASARADAALSIGETNRRAHELLGFRKTVDLSVLTVDFSQFEAARASAATVRKPSERARIVAIARLIPRKNILRTARAIDDDPALRDHVHLTCVGGGPEQAELEVFARRCEGLQVSVLGAVPRERVARLLGESDVLLLPSSDEPWGIVVTEALGLGIPVIATPAVGAAVSLAPAGAVVLSRSDSAEDVVQAIRAWIGARERYATAARDGASAVRSRYDRVAVVRELLAL